MGIYQRLRDAPKRRSQWKRKSQPSTVRVIDRWTNTASGYVIVRVRYNKSGVERLYRLDEFLENFLRWPLVGQSKR